MEHLKSRLRELMLLLLQAVDAGRHDVDSGLREVQEVIAAAGYDEQDMQELLDWLHARWQPEEGEPAWLAARQLGRASASSLRQMGQREDELLTPDAFGYLVELVRTRQISAEQMETLIQFAQLAPDGPLTRRDLDSLMDRVVFAPEPGRATTPGRFDRAH